MANQTPIIAQLINWLGVRRHRMWLRYKDDLSTRSIPKPSMPRGESSAISNNYYCSRDARREMAPPVIISRGQFTQQRLGTTTKPDTKDTVSFPTPGVAAKWTLSKEDGL